MTWQEYQDAVGELYDQMDDIGTVRRNITLPDKITGQPRQIDVWIEIEGKGHTLGILVDAKYRKDKVDVKDVEEVLALADAVGANLSVLVALNGWTEPAYSKAKFVGLDLKLLSLEDALDLIVPDKWMMCSYCEKDCIVADKQGGLIVDGMWSLLVAGQCRNCKAALIWCWDCGDNVVIDPDAEHECRCGHVWRATSSGIQVKRSNFEDWFLLEEGYDSLEEFALHIPEPSDPTPDDTDFYIRRGIAHRERGHGDEAIHDLNQALRLRPHSAVAYYQRAYTYDMAEHASEALADYSKAIELDPNLAMAFASRGAVFYSRERYREAAEDFRKFLTLMPDSPDMDRVQMAITHREAEIANRE